MKEFSYFILRVSLSGSIFYIAAINPSELSFATWLLLTFLISGLYLLAYYEGHKAGELK